MSASNETDPLGEIGTPEPCAFGGKPTLEQTTVSWGLGRVCLGCGLPVGIRIEHPQEDGRTALRDAASSAADFLDSYSDDSELAAWSPMLLDLMRHYAGDLRNALHIGGGTDA